MKRISPVNAQTAPGRAKEVLDVVMAVLGPVPNMTRRWFLPPLRMGAEAFERHGPESGRR